MTDTLKIGPYSFESRFILGSGKKAEYSERLINAAVKHAGVEMISVVIKKLEEDKTVLSYIPEGVKVLPNTLGARNADEAVELAHISRDMGFGDMIKIEIMTDSRYFLPSTPDTIAATRILVEEGFIVLPYIYPEISAAKTLVDVGAAAIMPLASPSGSSKGLATRDFIKMLIDQLDVPIIVDAGIGKPSHACEAMELGASAVMMNTALAMADNIDIVAEAFKKAIEAGRMSYLAGH